MKSIKNVKGGGYVNPACLLVEVTAEGMLCTSGVVENEFNSTLDNYVVKD